MLNTSLKAQHNPNKIALISIAMLFFTAALAGCATPSSTTDYIAQNKAPTEKLADAHFHSSNYAYQGVSLKQLIRDYMKDEVVRSTVMPLPLQQRWDGFETYQMPPNYYLGPKADVYYYAFADAMYAKEFLALAPDEKKRIDLMITGFNPMDKYATHHIKRALLTFPGVFSGIGEFTIHKELVSHKIAGEPITYTAPLGPLPPDTVVDQKLSLYSPAVAEVFKLVAETGLVATLHNDVYPVDVKYDGTVKARHPDKNYAAALIELCSKSPGATVIWAHTGLGRYVTPEPNHLGIVSKVLENCPNWYVDISWDLVQKYIMKPEPKMPTIDQWIIFIIQNQDRVLWGSDTVIYSRNKIDDQGKVEMGRRFTRDEYMAVPRITDHLFTKLGPKITQKVRLDNYFKLFDSARTKVRAWETKHVQDDIWDLQP